MITKKDNLASGVVDYFRNALAAVGRWSKYNNTKYPPVDGSKELRWSFDVSTEHADAIMSHLSQRGTVDPETGFSHTVALAWRALALLESELVAAGAEPGLAVVRGVPQGKLCPCGNIECTYEAFPDRELVTLPDYDDGRTL